MEKRISDIEKGVTLYLSGTQRYAHATIHKVGTSMGFPVYVVEFYMHNIRNHSWAYQHLNEAIEALTKRCYKFVR